MPDETQYNDLKVQTVPIESVKPYEKNTKKHDDAQIAKLAKNIETLGYWVPIVVDKAMVIISGHARLAALKQLGRLTVPVIVAERLSDDEVRTLRLADNKLNESPWDMDALKFELNAIGADMTLLAGFPALDLPALGEPEVDENTVKDAEKKFLNATIKQVVLHFPNDEYEEVMGWFARQRDAMKVETNTEVFLKMRETFDAEVQ